jgi:uncharacterized protein YecT (DUF1311 family)
MVQFVQNKFAISGLFFTLLLNVPALEAKISIDSCDDKKATHIAYSQCLDRVKHLVDRELKSWINNQTFLLQDMALNTGTNSALTMFNRSQSNFITFRENNCRWQYLALSPSKDAVTAFKKCYILTTQTRINELVHIKELIK